ncbi:MAG: extracellular solute-binding protein, partial [Clostridia bacterium]|nr:extracellular solute-binding protein [Clostridia bacterium]
MKRAISLFLVFVICFSLAACGGSGGSSNEANVDSTFPLKEPVTLKLMVTGTEDSAFKKNLENNSLYKRLKEETNVSIDFQFLGSEPKQKLTLLINSGQYGDAILGGPVLNYIAASRYIASGIFKDLTPYINEKITPNIYGIIQENPAALGMISGADGKIYTLPYKTAEGDCGVESPIWMNKVWLDKLGLAVPKTIDEFTNVLRAFRDKDPNGNGVQDEIPYLVSTARTYYSLEALCGSFGISCKNGDLDGFLQVVDGKVRFCPITDAWRDAVTYEAMLYDESLMWNECFTASSSTGLSKLTSETCLVGCFTSNTVPKSVNSKQYICIDPPKSEKYDICWYTNPSTVASKDRFYVTDKCKYTEILLKWVDKLYTFDSAFEAVYGTEEDGRWYTDENGVRVINESLSSDELARIDTEHPTMEALVERFPTPLKISDFKNKISDRSFNDIVTTEDVYGKWKTKELWPRPYLTSKDAQTVYKLTTDIFYQVATYRANWITGKTKIDDEWDS